MSKCIRIAAYLIIGTVLIGGVLVLVKPIRARLQSLYLSKAKIVGSISWSDAYYAKKAVRNDDPSEKCIRIGKEKVNGTNVMYAFTLLKLFEFHEDNDGKWRLVGVRPYDY